MNAQDVAITFEARKISMRQNKDGFVLVLGIHPNDLPKSQITSWVGAIWQVGMVEIGDDGMPIVPEEKRERMEAVARAGLLCRNNKFQTWITSKYPEFEENVFANTEKEKEEEAVTILRKALGVKSRAELKTDDIALARFKQLTSEFEETVNGGS